MIGLLVNCLAMKNTLGFKKENLKIVPIRQKCLLFISRNITGPRTPRDDYRKCNKFYQGIDHKRLDYYFFQCIKKKFENFKFDLYF